MNTPIRYQPAVTQTMLSPSTQMEQAVQVRKSAHLTEIPATVNGRTEHPEMAAPTNGRTVRRMDLLTCRIGSQYYGLPVMEVREVVRLPALLTLAGAPACCCGLLYLRGTHVPIIDSHILLDEPPHYSLTSQIIIIGRDKPQIGLLVAEVCEVLVTTMNHWAHFQVDTVSRILRGIVTHDNTNIIVFDVEALKQLVIPEACEEAA